MSFHPFTTFSTANRRLILLLIAGHLLWSCALLGLWASGSLLAAPVPRLSGAFFIALQLYFAAQLLLPALRLHPAQRSRGFYLFWLLLLAASVWLLNQLPVAGGRLPLPAVLQSALLLLVATVIGAVLAGYVRRLWEVVPVCVAMTLADVVSWRYGPTAEFARQIEDYYLAPEGPPPLIDMLLVKLVVPGAAGLAPVFGISDWIMVVFFAVVARRFGINDNLLGPSGAPLARQGRIGCYLPVPVVALLVAIVLAQATGLFLPALPLMALIMLLWYAGRYLLLRRRR